jgi:hypothetical protein
LRRRSIWSRHLPPYENEEYVILNAAAALLAVGACVVTGHWYLRRVDEIGRKVAFPSMWVAILVVLALLAAVPGVMRGRLEDRLSGVASKLSGRSVRVRCQALGGAFVDAGAEFGYVKFHADGTPVSWTLIKRDQCNDLKDYLHSNKRNPSIKRVIAVHVLTHESMHLASIADEASAECAAVQRDAQTARLLGASPADATALAQEYFASIYPRMDTDYRSPNCKAGGEMDEAREDAPWTSTA